MRRVRGPIILCAVVLGFAACGHDAPECLALPCAIPLAVQINVTSARGGPVADVAVTISGAVTGAASCNTDATATVCYVAGVAGTYELETTAPGFEPVRRTVTVSGTSPECGCPTVTTVRLDVVLDPNP
jgi:hypothetical protein